MKNRISVSLVLLFATYFSYSQLERIKFSKTYDLNDTIVSELISTKCYNFLYQRYDSSVYNIITMELANFKQELKVHKRTKNGYLVYTFEGRVMVKYEIKEGKLNGMGTIYSSLHKNSSGIAFEQGFFKNGFLNGVFIYSDWENGEIKFVGIYTNGKLIKVEYPIIKDIELFKRTHSFPGCLN